MLCGRWQRSSGFGWNPCQGSEGMGRGSWGAAQDVEKLWAVVESVGRQGAIKDVSGKSEITNLRLLGRHRDARRGYPVVEMNFNFSHTFDACSSASRHGGGWMAGAGCLGFPQVALGGTHTHAHHTQNAESALRRSEQQPARADPHWRLSERPCHCACSMCLPDAFTNKRNVAPHERTHTGEKPYSLNVPEAER